MLWYKYYLYLIKTVCPQLCTGHMAVAKVTTAVLKWPQFYINIFNTYECDWDTYLCISVFFAILTRVHLHISNFDHAPPQNFLGLTNIKYIYEHFNMAVFFLVGWLNTVSTVAIILARWPITTKQSILSFSVVFLKTVADFNSFFFFLLICYLLLFCINFYLFCQHISAKLKAIS